MKNQRISETKRAFQTLLPSYFYLWAILAIFNQTRIDLSSEKYYTRIIEHSVALNASSNK